MTDSGIIVVSIIGALQAITIALIALWASRAGKTNKAVNAVGKDVQEVGVNAKAAKEQVVNNHDTNMREENDKRHSETLRWFSALSAKVDRQGNRADMQSERMDKFALRLDGVEADLDTKKDRDYVTR